MLVNTIFRIFRFLQDIPLTSGSAEGQYRSKKHGVRFLIATKRTIFSLALAGSVSRISQEYFFLFYHSD